MSEKLSNRILQIQEPSTIKMARLSRELRDKGFNIINLSLGEPDFGTPEHIKEAAINAINDGYTHYPPVAGYQDVREAVAHKFKRDNHLTYSANQIIISTGAKQSIINALLCLLDEGDEIIIPTPYWVSYPEMVKLCEATPVFVNADIENDYKITPTQLESVITERTRAFIFSSPCNPTGSAYSKDELAGLAEVFKKYPDIFIISDEIYEYINFEGTHHSLAQFPELYNRTAVISGLSKGFAMTGWRIGILAGPEYLVKACDKIQAQFTSGACTISQRATIVAMTGTMEPTHEMCKAFKARRDLVMNKLSDIPGMKYNKPEGAFYLFPDVSHYFGSSHNGEIIKNADDFCMYLLEKAQVSLVSGTGFGAPNCIRISFAASQEMLEEAIERIKKALADLIIK